MRATIALALAELQMLARNRLAAITAVVLPLAGGLWIITDSPGETPLGSVAAIAAFQLLAVLGFTVVNTASATLVARRQQGVLSRWRMSGATDHQILVGTVAPAVALLVIQAGVLFAALAVATGSAPTQPGVLVLAIVLASATGCALAFVVASLTRSVEAVNMTVLPVLLALIGGGLWAATAATGSVTWLMRVTGGGALVELVRIGWGASELKAVLPEVGSSLVVLVAIAGGAALLVSRIFRWGARA